MTHAMKNLVGTLPASQYGINGSSTRQAIHNHSDKLDKNKNSNLCRVVLDLNSANKIHLAVNDAIKTADNGEGPWNKGFAPVVYNKLITSKDPVAADAISTKVMGFDPMAADRQGPFSKTSLPGSFDGTDNYLRIAEEVGLGVHNLEKIEEIDASINTRVERRG